MILEPTTNGDVIINFTTQDCFTEPEIDENGVQGIWPMEQRIYKFSVTESQIPEYFHITTYPFTSTDGENLDSYEINLKNYRITSTSKPIIDKYFEYILSKDNKTFKETYPECFV